MNRPLLIFIATYNEAENVEPMCHALLALGLDADLLFCDDHSPDGSGAILDRLAAANSRIQVLHRPGKQGIGSAHQVGIAYAYAHGYEQLITLDCDFTHSPADLPRLIEAAHGAAVTLGSRWQRPGSLPGWSWFRRVMTGGGRLLTRCVLGLPHDATGALRLYNLRKIPSGLFELVQSQSYGFFAESLFVLEQNGFTIHEIPIVLPARTYGHSKMTLGEAGRTARLLLQLRWEHWWQPARFHLQRPVDRLAPELVDPQHWDPYWNRKGDLGGSLYEFVAGLYRRAIITPNLSRFVRRHFPPGAHLLHAGCGSGQVDMAIRNCVRLTAVDISAKAVQLYARHNPAATRIEQADIFQLPFPNGVFDGVYNLGVMEHFTAEDITRILTEFRRVMHPGGKVLLFWPSRHAPSVWILHAVHFFLHRCLGRQAALHPPEISLLRSRYDAQAHVERAGLRLVDYYYGPRDGFIQAVLVAANQPATLKSAAGQ